MMVWSVLASISILFASLFWAVAPLPEQPPQPARTEAKGSARIWYMIGDQLWSMGLNGDGPAQISAGVRRLGGDCPSFYVSPDSRNVAFQANDGQLMVAGAGGGAHSLAAGRIGSVSWSPDSRRLIYTLNDDVYIQDTAEGHKPQTIATGSGRFFFPTFAPDGQNIAVLESTGGNTLNVMVVRTSNQEWRSLGVTAAGEAPDNLCADIVSWSPDSTRLVVDYGQPVFVFYLAGGTPTQVGGQGGARLHFWSPSGNLLAFKEMDGSLWLVNPDGSGQRPLVAEPVGGVDWNPAGRPLITYATSAGDLWIINIQNGQKQQLTGGDNSRENSPNWTPDGSAVIFSRQSRSGSEEGIWKVNANGSGLAQLSSSGGALQVQ
jgi:Tol biopolymer transport system component